MQAFDLKIERRRLELNNDRELIQVSVHAIFPIVRPEHPRKAVWAV